MDMHDIKSSYIPGQIVDHTEREEITLRANSVTVKNG
jgi:hypothetical protein